MLNETQYSEIFDALSPVLPKGWRRTLLYLEYGAASYTFAYYVDSGNGWVKCYDLGIPDAQILAAFSEIDRIVKPTRSEGEVWSNLTMQISSDLKVHIDFDYTDLSENAFAYKREWRKKYLS